MATKTVCDVCDDEIRGKAKTYGIIIAPTILAAPGYVGTPFTEGVIPLGGMNTRPSISFHDVCSQCTAKVVRFLVEQLRLKDLPSEVVENVPRENP